ncbi:MORN repeat-containing protein [Oxalobacteraceae bacterium A2-2]
MRPLPLLLLALAAHAVAAEPAYTGPADCRIADPRPAAGRSASWNGACKDGYADGPGALQWTLNGKDTERYEGPLQRGLPNGDGVYQRADGSLAQGDYKDGQLDGKGIIVRPNGDKLVGSFQQGRVTGQVKFYSHNGDVYEGGWNAGPDGVGTIRYALGGSYSGHWRNGKPWGEGAITYSNGQVLKGQFAGSFQLGGPALEGKPQPGNYDIKEDSPRTGSNLRSDAARGYQVPPDKSYADLTPEQQQLVRQPYAILQAGDAPPYPVGGMVELSRALSRLGGQMRGRGMLQAQVWVDENGAPQRTAILEAPDKEFGDMVARVLLLVKYTPGRCAGQPCAMAVPFKYMFTLSP